MSPAEKVYAPPPPSAPPREALISSDLANASRQSPPPSLRGDPKAVQVRPYSGTKIPSERAHLMMSRFSFGYSREQMAQMRRDGGPDAWFERQLKPTRDPGPRLRRLQQLVPRPELNPRRSKWDHVLSGQEGLVGVRRRPRELDAAQANQLAPPAARDHGRLLVEPPPRSLDPRHGVELAQPLRLGAASRGAREVRRPSRCREPAPGDAPVPQHGQSTKEHPDENQGRELLELHTVGVDAGYTETMVKASAKILTGYTVNTWRNWKGRYDSSIHWTGHVKVLDFESDNTDPDGRAVTKAYLRYLAHHPATAHRLATKLAQRFVSDSPSADLVDALANAYLVSGTTSALRCGPSSPTQSSARRQGQGAQPHRGLPCDGTRARRQGEASAQAVRLAIRRGADLDVQGPVPVHVAAAGRAAAANDAWSSASQVLGSLDTHYSLAGGWVGDKGSAHYHTHEWWLPQPQLRFDAYVDHLCRMLLGRESTPRLLKAALPGDGRRPGRESRTSTTNWCNG